MNRFLRTRGAACERALGILALERDGDAAAEESAWLHRHLEACGACRATMAEFAEMDGRLVGWGRQISQEHAPSEGDRERLGRMMTPAARRPSWLAPAAVAVAAGLAAVIALLFVAPHKPRAPMTSEDASFVEIPYLPPLDPRENTVVVRMDIEVRTLLAAGYRMAADPNTMVSADVLIGEDGRAHAVRVVSDLNRN